MSRSKTTFEPLEIDLAGVHSMDASAGTGKTYTIATLFLRYIVEAGFTVEQILVTTFTEAATAELRDRLRQRLQSAYGLTAFSQDAAKEKADADPSLVETVQLLENAKAWDDSGDPVAQARHRLEAALTDFDKAAIYTIHGFCNQLLTQLVFETRSRFGAEMVDTVDPLIERAVDDHLARLWCGPEGALSDWLPLEEKLRKDMLKVAKDAVKHPDCLVEPSGDEVEGLLESGLYIDFEKVAKGLAKHWPESRSEILKALDAAIADKVLNGRSYKAKTVQAALAAADQFVASLKPAQLADNDKIELLAKPNLIAKANKGKDKLVPEHPVFDLVGELLELAEKIDAQQRRLRAAILARAATEASNAVERAKQESGTLSFADMLHLVDRAIDQDPQGVLVGQLQSRYPVVLVDEFQDTDPVQFRIFCRAFQGLAREAQENRSAAKGSDDAPIRGFVMIGDPKQSIYRFRGADLNSYFAATRDEGVQHHTMMTNWRSDQSLVNGVLALLGDDPFKHDKMGLPLVSAHHGDRLIDRDAVELVAVPSHASGSMNKKLAFRQVLAMLIDDIVAELNDPPRVKSGDGSERLIQSGDVAVLCRAGWQLREIQRTLASRGVPTVLCTDQSVFDTPEAEDVYRVLLSLNNLSDRRAVITALATPILGLSAEELVNLTEEDNTSLAQWLERLHAWRRLWNDQGFMELWQSIMSEAGTEVRLAKQVSGERALTNLRHLGELLHGKARADHLGPTQLTDWLGRALDDDQVRDHAARAMQIRLESDADAVQLSTIHKSKGLEYPVVYCPTLWDARTRNKRNDPPHAVARVDEDGKPLNRPILDTGSDKLAARLDDDEEESLEEDRRLLYVALTRARHACRIHWATTESSHKTALGSIAKLPGFSSRGKNKPSAWERDESIRDCLQAYINGMKVEERTIDGVILRNAVAVVNTGSNARYKPPVGEEQALVCKPIERAWVPSLVTTSFSALAAVATHTTKDLEADALHTADRDTVLAVLQEPSPGSDTTVPLAEMPGGRRVGDLVHNVLESLLLAASVENGTPEEVAEALQKLLVDQMPRVNLDPQKWLEPLSTSLSHCLTASISAAEDCSLIQVQRADLAPEVEFLLGAGSDAGSFEPARLAEPLLCSENLTVQKYARTLESIDRKQMNGFLGGFIDLVFCWQDRWYLVDYKTNKLGTSLSAYGPEGMANAMIHHHYVLQYHLYAVALHRLLAQRISDYQYETHFGGIAYLFIRGMVPGNEANHGVYFDRPSPVIIESLSDTLAGMEVAV